MVNIEYAEALLQGVSDEIIVVSDDLFQLLNVTLGRTAEQTVIFSGTHYAELFRSAGFTVWSGVEPEPSTATVEKMADFLREKQPENVVAAGGGSVLDAAKAAYLVYQTGWQLSDLFGVNRWSSANPGKKLKRMVAIPTTSGTGSEVTSFAVITDPAAGSAKIREEFGVKLVFVTLGPKGCLCSNGHRPGRSSAWCR